MDAKRLRAAEIEHAKHLHGLLDRRVWMQAMSEGAAAEERYLSGLLYDANAALGFQSAADERGWANLADLRARFGVEVPPHRYRCLFVDSDGRCPRARQRGANSRYCVEHSRVVKLALRRKWHRERKASADVAKRLAWAVNIERSRQRWRDERALWRTVNRARLALGQERAHKDVFYAWLRRVGPETARAAAFRLLADCIKRGLKLPPLPRQKNEAKLTPAQRRELRRRRAAGETYEKLGRSFGICQQSAQGVVKGRKNRR